VGRRAIYRPTDASTHRSSHLIAHSLLHSLHSHSHKPPQNQCQPIPQTHPSPVCLPVTVTALGNKDRRQGGRGGGEGRGERGERREESHAHTTNRPEISAFKYPPTPVSLAAAWQCQCLSVCPSLVNPSIHPTSSSPSECAGAKISQASACLTVHSQAKRRKRRSYREQSHGMVAMPAGRQPGTR